MALSCIMRALDGPVDLQLCMRCHSAGLFLSSHPVDTTPPPCAGSAVGAVVCLVGTEWPDVGVRFFLGITWL